MELTGTGLQSSLRLPRKIMRTVSFMKNERTKIMKYTCYVFKCGKYVKLRKAVFALRWNPVAKKYEA